MSRVIADSKPGDSLYIIEGFHCSPKGKPLDKNTLVEFLPGMRVKYIDFRWNSDREKYNRQNLMPTWLVTFEYDGVRYEATQDFFMTQRAWHNLMGVFGIEKELKKPTAAADNSYADTWGWVAVVATIVLISGFIWLCSGVMFSLTNH